MKSGLIIVSGGMDSVTLLHQQKNDIALGISFDYGSKHNAKEIPFAKEHCQDLGIEHLIIELGFMGQYFSSNLLRSGGPIPEGHYEDESMKQTVVPFRNGIMLGIAGGLAESRGLDRVYIGNHAGDHAIYPDCRRGFIGAMSEALYLGTYRHVLIAAPYTGLNKREIALIGRRLGVDYSRTWTCYKGGEVHCGVCGSCVERREALAGFDPTEYAG